MTQARKPLHDRHRKNLRESGLDDAMIEACGFYSEDNPAEIVRILNWRSVSMARALGSCLAIPFADVQGNATGFIRLKPDCPRIDRDKFGNVKLNSRGEEQRVKYEQPSRVPARAFFPPGVRAAIESGSPLGITEGEKKAAAATQAGLPCIGLCGVWNFASGTDAKGERLLISDLAGVDWRGRIVWIAFDADSKRNPGVNHAAAELARVLTGLGADVRFVTLPNGPADEKGLPGKMGLDDALMAFGPDPLRAIVNKAISPVRRDPRDLADYRAELRSARLESLGVPGLYLDTSPAGAGKSTADLAAAKAAGNSLVVLQTHRNCRELQREMKRAGMDAAAYPPLSAKTCQRYDEARDALAYGLSVAGSICLRCEHKKNSTCDYWSEMKAAESAPHSIATHSRAGLNLRGLCEGKKFVAVHEDAASLLRPTKGSGGDFLMIADIADAAGHEAWSEAAQNEGVDEKRAGRETSARQFFAVMAAVAQRLAAALASSGCATELDGMPQPVGRPDNADDYILRAVKSKDLRPSPEAMQICRAAAAGETESIVCRIDHYMTAGREKEQRRSIFATWRASLPAKSVLWIEDATATKAEIESLVGPGHLVIDRTPLGEIAQQHPVVQVPIDILQSTKASVVCKLVRGVLAAYPECRKVGIICHREHHTAILGKSKGENLDAASRDRLAVWPDGVPAVEYFRSGAGRGSNEWHGQCDLLLIAGTPRVPPAAVRSRLLQLGKTAAAGRDGQWEKDWWAGMTTSGRRVTVRCPAYRDWEWYNAHRSVVAAELRQALGRGRGICPDGIPVVLLTTENLDLPLLDRDIQPVTDGDLAVLKILADLSEQFSTGAEKKNRSPNGQEKKSDCTAHRNKTLNTCIVENCSVSSSTVASRLGVTERHARTVLGRLEAVGLVVRNGQRGGWRIQPATGPIEQVPPAAAPPATVEAQAAAVVTVGTVDSHVHAAATGCDAPATSHATPHEASSAIGG